MAGKHVSAELSEDQEVNLGLIITPMLDMAFQLLAFFVMTYHPSALEGHIGGKLLPPDKAVKSENPTPSPKVDPISANVEPDVKDFVKVTMKAVSPSQSIEDRAEGQLAQILVQSHISSTPETVADTNDDLKAGLQKLNDWLVNFKKDHPAESLVIRLQPDGNLKHGYVVAVWNTCRVAGYENISFIAPQSVK